jgi:hypothetical protein
MYIKLMAHISPRKLSTFSKRRSTIIRAPSKEEPKFKPS